MSDSLKTHRVRRDPVSKDDLPLPPPKIRCGDSRFREDDFYLRSGAATVRLLEDLCGLEPEMRLLDVGCGCGRLLTGLLGEIGLLREYVGVDFDRRAINWAKRRLEDADLGITFHRVDVLNERYNPKGASHLPETFLPVPDERFDRVVAMSVFGHMRLGDIRRYLDEIRRALAPGGKVCLSLFAEYGVSVKEENLEGLQRSWLGRLHRIRIHRHRFEEHVYAAGLQVDSFRHRNLSDGQSTYVLSAAGVDEAPGAA
jgi:SAM-dependent methyltransferase